MADEHVLEYIGHDILRNGALINQRLFLRVERPLYKAEEHNAILCLSSAHKGPFSSTLGITGLGYRQYITSV